jgi:hypothetical protein
VAGSNEYSDEPVVSGTTELVMVLRIFNDIQGKITSV